MGITRVRGIITPAAFSVTPATPAGKAVDQVPALKVRRMLVVDDAGVPLGVIRALDVLRHLR